jgi:hypothetical protein
MPVRGQHARVVNEGGTNGATAALLASEVEEDIGKALFAASALLGKDPERDGEAPTTARRIQPKPV